jgi:hypothetical protein
MNNIGYSTFSTDTIHVDLSPYRGSTGPTGPRGNTGSNGLTGATGNTGIGVSFILFTNTDGITVYLGDGTEIYVNGLSGPTYTDFSSTGLDVYYKMSGSTGIVLNQSFEIRGSVSGLTANFKPIKFMGGLTAIYSGSDVKISGITIAGGYALGETGAALRSSGNTAAAYLKSLFKYEQNTAGITTVNIAKIKVSQFNQSNTSYNQNLSSTSLNVSNFISGTTANIAFTQYDLSTTPDIKRVNQVNIFSENAKIGGITGPKIIFRKETTYKLDQGVGVPYSVYEYGSCCFCDGSGRPRCLDYVNKSMCDTLQNGVFSQDSCSNRRTGNCADIGKCCFPTNGACVDLTSFDCLRLGGNFTRNAICTSNICAP